MNGAGLNSRRVEPPPMGELTTEIHINVDEIPDHVRDRLAASTLDLVRGILRQPGGREALDAQTRARNARLANATTGRSI